MNKFFIHAGFSKTGSSSIQYGLGHHLAALNHRGYFLFGKNITLGRDGAHPRLPLWCLEDAAREGRMLTETVLQAAGTVGPDDTLLLTSENLSQLSMPALFAGIDRHLDVTVVFYMRPQTDWIASAWKQWGLKTGVTLEAYASGCLELHHPSYLSFIEAWQNALGSARILVRPFFMDVMAGGDPAVDFFSIIGFEDYRADLLGSAVNSSMDCSLLHVMMLNASSLFTGIHDLRLDQRLTPRLPAEARSSNLPMLSDDMQAAIEEHFREETQAILRRFSGITDVDRFYADHFVPRPNGGRSYMEADEAELLSKCFSILMEALGRKRGAAALGSMLKKVLEE